MRLLILICSLALMIPSLRAADQDDTAGTTDQSSRHGTGTSLGGHDTTSPRPAVAENGDRRNADNDGDGRKEPVHVKGYERKDGTYVREHYRAEPKK